MTEKTLVFLPMIIFFAFFGALIIGFFALIGKLINKQKGTAWVGTVVDKIHNTVRDREYHHKINHFYVIVVKTDEGKQVKWGVAKEQFDQYQKGDRFKKEKGKIFPIKIN